MFKFGAFFVVIISVIYFYYQKKGLNVEIGTKNIKSNNPIKLFKSDELKLYNGVDIDLMYLSILGSVFDVTSGKRHYGPDSDYNIFIGQDASKCFVTGDFTKSEDKLDDVLSLSNEDLLGISDWKKMYEKQYIYKGKLIGRFYDDTGDNTEYMKIVQRKIKEALQQKKLKEKDNQYYPPCNSEWSATTGTRVWCTRKSGGVERDWEGVPRLLYSIGSAEPKCVCIKSKEAAKHISQLKEYENCDPSSTSCQVVGV